MKINKKNGISLVVLVITIIIIIILAGAVLLNLLDSNVLLQASKATYLSNVRNFQIELDLYKQKQLLDNMGTYDPSLLYADLNSVTYNGNTDNTKTIYNLIPSLNLLEEYAEQFVVINGQLIYRELDSNKQEWAKEIDVNNTVTNISVSDNYVVAQMKDGTAMAWGQNHYGQLGDGTTEDKYVPTKVLDLENVKQISNSMSINSTVALLNDGTVKAWGYNGYGQLGDGTKTTRTIPVLISGLTNVKQIEVSNYHTVALLNDGTVMAWGRNNYGQLGDGTNVDKSVPTAIQGLTNVKKIYVGIYCTVALLEDGTVKSWGQNTYGQLGDGTTVNKNVPTSVLNLTSVKQISVSNTYNMIALLNDGTVMTWGYNNYGQLGDGTIENKSVPTAVSGLDNVAEVITNNSVTIAVLNDGTAKAWGYNYNYQIGNGSSVNRNIPTAITNLTNINQIYIGNNYVVCLLNDGTVKTWGRNYYGQLGDGTTSNKTVPTIVSGLNNVKQIITSNAYYTTVILLNDGTLMTCGANGWGQLGDGTVGNRMIPTVIPNLTEVANVSIGNSYNTVALLNNGTLKAWGRNTYGQIGDGTTVNKSIPATVTQIDNVKQITANIYNTAALLDDETVKVWGYNSYGQIGDGTLTSRYVPTAVSNLSDVKQILACNAYSTVALLNDGTLKAWGYNTYGQLGDGTTVHKNIPTIVLQLNNVKQIDAGSYHIAAVLNDGTVKAWGYNNYGQVGDGTLVNKNIPTEILNLSNVSQIVCDNTSTTLAILNDGTAKAWGRNTYGQVGDGTNVDKYAPATVTGLTNVKQVVMGTYHTVALLNDGTVKAWGYNAYGQLGDGTSTTKYVPTTVKDLTNVKQVIASNYFTLAVLEDGTVKSWGQNNYGQLGIGTVLTQILPTTIPGLTNVKQLISKNNYVVAILEDGTVKSWGYNSYGQLGIDCTPFSLMPKTISIF